MTTVQCVQCARRARYSGRGWWNSYSKLFADDTPTDWWGAWCDLSGWITLAWIIMKLV